MDQEGGDNAEDKARNQLHGDPVQPQVDCEHCGRVDEGCLWWEFGSVLLLIKVLEFQSKFKRASQNSVEVPES